MTDRATTGPPQDWRKIYQYVNPVVQSMSPIQDLSPEIRIGPRPRIASSSARKITQECFIGQLPCK